MFTLNMLSEFLGAPLKEPGAQINSKRFISLIFHPESAEGATPEGTLRYDDLEAHLDMSALGEDHKQRLADFCAYLAEWERQMQEILIERGSYSDLLNVSYKHLGIPVIISDATLKILAYTCDELPKELIAREAVAHGSFTQEAFDEFHGKASLKKWQERTKLTYSDSTTAHRDYPVYFYNITFPGNYYIHVVGHLQSKVNTPGLFDAFKFFIDCLERLIYLKEPNKAVFEAGNSALLVRFLKGELENKGNLTQQLFTHPIFSQGPWYVLCIDYVEQGSVSHIREAALDLIHVMPYTSVGIDAGKLYALISSASINEISAALDQHAKKYPYKAAHSDLFVDRTALHFAGMQARTALMLEEAFPTSPSDKSSLCSFSRHYIDYFMCVNQKDEGLVDYMNRRSIPERLRLLDLQHGNNDYEIIQMYLTCERRASVAAKALDMHRNTLLYRLQHIEKLYDISFENKYTCERMQMEFRLHTRHMIEKS